jgi:hypothetical protein
MRNQKEIPGLPPERPVPAQPNLPAKDPEIPTIPPEIIPSPGKKIDPEESPVPDETPDPKS